MNKLLIICGPTASGKTNLSVDCALKFGTEIISADSQLIYEGLNIGTAKPTEEEMRGVKHHLIDVVKPECAFSVSDYERLAEPTVKKLFSENKTPIICGGTGFYINSLLYDFSYGSTQANTKIREKYDRLLKERGKSYLYEELKRVDSETAEKLHVNDTKRVIRALEIYEASGKKKSEIKDIKVPKYSYLAVAIEYDREELYQRIDGRVDEMIKHGLIDEVKNLLDRGVPKESQCFQAIGYKEVLQYFDNGYNFSTMRDIIKQNTRHYAKRQITFFKKMEGLIWLKPQEATADKVSELLNG